MKYIYWVIILILSSCSETNKIKGRNSNISFSKIPCGSYEIKSLNLVVGYVVKPFAYPRDSIEKLISDVVFEFEKMLSQKNDSYYDNSYRVYYFTKNRIGDIKLIVLMLTKKQAGLINGWKCLFLDVESYRTRYRHKSSRRRPDTFYFNYSKRYMEDSYSPSE